MPSVGCFTRERATRLLATMPPAFRSLESDPPSSAWSILDDMLWRMIDANCRAVLEAEDMHETISGRDNADPHVAWLSGLLDGAIEVDARGRERQGIIRGVRGWIARLEERGASSTWRLCLRLNEPLDALLTETKQPVPNVPWSLSFHLQAGDAEHVVVDAADIWVLPSDGVSIEGLRLDDPHELLLAELARAARLFKPIEKALEHAEPVDLELDTRQAYDFLREVKPLLLEQGFGVDSPDWWETSRSRTRCSPTDRGRPRGSRARRRFSRHDNQRRSLCVGGVSVGDRRRRHHVESQGVRTTRGAQDTSGAHGWQMGRDPARRRRERGQVHP